MTLAQFQRDMSQSRKKPSVENVTIVPGPLQPPIASFWHPSPIFCRFSLSSVLILAAAILVLGRWTTMQIENAAVQATTATAVVFSDTLIAPHFQSLERDSPLSADSLVLLDKLLTPGALGKANLEFNIWKDDTIVFASRKERTGQSVAPTKARLGALSGHVTVAFSIPDGSNNSLAPDPHLQILHIYVPVRQTGTDRVVALVEAYRPSLALANGMDHNNLQLWLIVIATNFALYALHPALTADQLITQRDRIAALQQLLAEKCALGNRSTLANQRLSDVNERFLRRLGANLHDGPVQLLGLAQLRLGTLRRLITSSDGSGPSPAATQELGAIGDAIEESLDEIRNVAIGLVPPEISNLELASTLTMAAKRHQRRTGKPVACNIAALPDGVPMALKSCLYRFVQEALYNANRHADGLGQTLCARTHDDRIEVSVLDNGPGFPTVQSHGGRGGQGLMLQRDRIEALGGRLLIANRPAGGAAITAAFDLKSGEQPVGEPDPNSDRR